MAWIAHVVRTEAAVQSSGATVLALPVDLLGAVFLTRGLTSTDLLQNAVLAQQVLFLGVALLSVGHLLLAVDQASEVRLLTAMALVEGATMVGVLLRLAKVCVALGRKTLILEDALFLSIDQSLTFDLALKAKEWTQLSSDGS